MIDRANKVVSLIMPYKMEFLNVVVAFVAEMGKSLGANEREMGQLRLAAEEVFAYIMEAFPASDCDDVFYLRGEEAGDMVKFTFSYHSTPINVRATPDFTVSDIEASLDGLGLSLAKQVTDSFECINCGNEGWVIVFTKRFVDFNSVLYRQGLQAEAKSEGQQSGSLHITRASVRHVPQLIDLVYRTYRYSYGKKYFYDEDSLKKVIEDEQLVALVAEDSTGKVIGSVDVFFDSPQVAEVGGVMVDPRYRNSAAIMLLARQSIKLFREDLFKNTVLYVIAVTTHTNSQQLMKLYKFAPLGLRLSLYDHANFIGIAADQKYRESLLFGILASSLAGREIRLYVPPEHKEMVTALFANTGIVTQVLSDELPSVACSFTSMTSVENKEIKVVDLQVNEIGSDFKEVLKNKTLAIQQDGFLTCLLTVPADKILPTGVEQVLKENKYFFSGLHISSEKRWYLLYTNLFHQRFQFSNVKLYDFIAQELLRYAEKEYLAIYQ